MRHSSLTRLGTDLGRMLRSMELDATAREALAVASWETLVGEQIADATQAVGIRGGVLEVVTRSSAWNQELAFRKAVLIQLLNRQVGAETVTDIRFKVGRVPPRPEEPQAPTPGPNELAAIPVPDPIARRIDAAAAHPDPDLAALIHRALTHEWQLDEWRRRHGYHACAECGAMCEPGRAVCPMCARDHRLLMTQGDDSP